MDLKTYYKEKVEYDKSLKTNDYSCLRYLSKKALRKIYPKGGYILIGGIGSGLTEKAGTFYYEEKEYPYFTLHYSNIHHGIDGYIDCGNDTYLAVIKGRGMRNAVKVVSALLLVIGIIFGVYTMTRETYLDTDAKDYKPSAEVKLKADPNHIALPGYGEINMEADTDIVYMALWNPPVNPCYFQFTILMEGKELYQSGLIEPGKAVTKIKLNQKITKGEHAITIKIDTFSLDDKDIKLNGGEIRTKFIGIKR